MLSLTRPHNHFSGLQAELGQTFEKPLVNSFKDIQYDWRVCDLLILLTNDKLLYVCICSMSNYLYCSHKVGDTRRTKVSSINLK